jgi:large subunit ribosomal protein L19
MLSLSRAALAGPALARPALARAGVRAASTYPFSKLAIIPPAPTDDPPASLKQGKGLMAYLQQTMPTTEKQRIMSTLFSRRHPDRLIPGSIITIGLTHAPHTFSGILLQIRRRGIDTSFTVRNVIARAGIEMQFFVNSPHVKEIKVLRRASYKNGDRFIRQHKAKIGYLQDQPERMARFAAGLKLD